MNIPIPTDTQKIVDDLKVATGWQRISYVNGSYVIGFDVKNMQSIKGLIRGQNCFDLSFTEFNNLPLSFYITADARGGNISTHQYWTINGRRHRSDDKPAYVAYDEENDRIIRRWYWNGLLHRTSGPAQEMIKGFTVTNDQPDQGYYDGYQKEDWSLMVLEWWEEGFPCRFPIPKEATIENGWRIRNQKTKKLETPQKDHAAWGADIVNVSWNSMDSDPISDMFKPTTLEVVELMEWYQDGVLADRTCAIAEFEWIRQGKILKDGLTKFNEAIRTNLISDLNFWNGPFYPNSEIEFLLLSEFERVGKDAE